MATRSKHRTARPRQPRAVPTWLGFLLATTATATAGPPQGGCTPNTQEPGPGDPTDGDSDGQPPPTPPTDVSATAGIRQVRIEWAASAGATGFDVYWQTAADVSPDKGTQVASVTSPWVHRDLNNGTAYYYVVVALGPGGASDPSAVVTATPELLTPSAVGATAGNGQVTLQWDPIGGATGYNIYWSTTPGPTPATATAIPNAQSPHEHLGLQNNTTYYYVVTALDGTTESAPSASVAATPSLPAPSGLIATPGDMEIVLQWDAVAGATSYGLFWVVGDVVSPSTGNTIPDVTSPHTHTGLTNGIRLSYVVVALDAGGEGPPSEIASATPGPPPIPEDLSVIAGYQQVELRWTQVADATSYTLYWATSPGVTKATGTAIADAAPPYPHTARTNGTTYHYVVTSVGPGGESEVSNEVAGTPGLYAPDGVTAEAGVGAVTISWKTAPAPLSHALYWGTNPGVTQATGGQLAPVTSPYVHTGRQPGTTYYYVVTTLDATDESAESAEVSAPALLPAPSNVVATAMDETVRLSWDAVAGADSYDLYWSTAADMTVDTGTRVADVASPHLHPGGYGTTYYFVVTALTNGVEGAASERVAATITPRWLAYRVLTGPTTTELYTLSVNGPGAATPHFLGEGAFGAALTFAPDGNKVAWQQNDGGGDTLYVYVAETSTSATGAHHRLGRPGLVLGAALPRWSPDGHWVAYMSDEDGANQRNLFLADVRTLPAPSPIEVNAQRLLGPQPVYRFTPDGVWLLFLAQGELYAFNTQTLEPATLLNEAAVVGNPVTAFEISRSGSVVVMMAEDPTTLLNELHTVRLTEDPIRALQTTSELPLAAYRVSPDGSELLYLTSGDLYVVATTGPIPQAFAVNRDGTVTLFAWSHSGTDVVFCSDQANPGRYELFRIGRHQIPGAFGDRLSDTMIDGGNVLELVVTRDDQRVVYLADQDTDTLNELFVAEMDNAAAVAAKLNNPLNTDGAVTGFAVAPDSRSVLLTAYSDASDPEQLYLADLINPSVPLPATLVNPLLSTDGSVGSENADFDMLSEAYATDGSHRLFLAKLDDIAPAELFLAVEGDSGPAPSLVSDLDGVGIDLFTWAGSPAAPRRWEPEPFGP